MTVPKSNQEYSKNFWHAIEGKNHSEKEWRRQNQIDYSKNNSFRSKLKFRIHDCKRFNGWGHLIESVQQWKLILVIDQIKNWIHESMIHARCRKFIHIISISERIDIPEESTLKKKILNRFTEKWRQWRFLFLLHKETGEERERERVRNGLLQGNLK